MYIVIAITVAVIAIIANIFVSPVCGIGVSAWVLSSGFFNMIDGETSDVAFCSVPFVSVYVTSTFSFVGVSTFIIVLSKFSFKTSLYLKDAVSPAFRTPIVHVMLLFSVFTSAVTFPILACSTISKL